MEGLQGPQNGLDTTVTGSVIPHQAGLCVLGVYGVPEVLSPVGVRVSVACHWPGIPVDL